MTNLYKILFFMTLILGTIITISSYTWVGMWMGLEINLLSIIPLMNSTKNPLASESGLKYFITQTIASSILLYMMISSSMIETLNYWSSKEFTSMIINSALLMKMGAAPLHFWFPEIMEGLSWVNSLIMMTWQKIAPSILLACTMKNLNLIYLFIISSIMIGGIMGINQMSLRKILAYSSINHIGWMLTALIMNLSIWMNYFLIYTFISMNLIILLKSANLYFMNQLFTVKNNLLKISFLVNFMSMGGVPPFLGFLPKWMVLNNLVKNNMTLAITLVILTLITLFLYMRTIIPSLTLNNVEYKINQKMSSNFVIWWTNWMNIVSLLACTLWFNLT